MFELIFLKNLLQISIFLLQTVPKYYINILYTVKNLGKMIFKPPSPKNSLFPIRPNPKKFKICNGDIYEIYCETMAYFTSMAKSVIFLKLNLFWRFAKFCHTKILATPSSSFLRIKHQIFRYEFLLFCKLAGYAGLCSPFGHYRDGLTISDKQTDK